MDAELDELRFGDYETAIAAAGVLPKLDLDPH
jgi:hypothetical protein